MQMTLCSAPEGSNHASNAQDEDDLHDGADEDDEHGHYDDGDEDDDVDDEDEGDMDGDGEDFGVDDLPAMEDHEFLLVQYLPLFIMSMDSSC